MCRGLWHKHKLVPIARCSVAGVLLPVCACVGVGTTFLWIFLTEKFVKKTKWGKKNTKQLFLIVGEKKYRLFFFFHSTTSTEYLHIYMDVWLVTFSFFFFASNFHQSHSFRFESFYHTLFLIFFWFSHRLWMKHTLFACIANTTFARHYENHGEKKVRIAKNDLIYITLRSNLEARAISSFQILSANSCDIISSMEHISPAKYVVCRCLSTRELEEAKIVCFGFWSRKFLCSELFSIASKCRFLIEQWTKRTLTVWRWPPSSLAS